MVKKATEERESGYKPPLKSKLQDIESYDVVFIGFPVWGMALPSPIRSFLSEYDLSGKTIVPFCPHGGYGQGQSFNTVKELSPQSNLLEGFAIEGERAAMAQPDVRKWLQEIKLIEESTAQTATPATSRAETKVYTNSIGMEFISIPSGSFMMGASDKDRDAHQSEKPHHKVTISKPFLIGQHEVTQAQWEAVMGSNSYTLEFTTFLITLWSNFFSGLQTGCDK